MKKIVEKRKKLSVLCVSLLCMLGLSLSARAVTVTNEPRGVTATVTAQAQMLKELGLFRGTEKGFELDRGMTRDEAAAMLVRYLGAEEKARTGTWKHPFTDVSAWADPYVGWLYQSGLTKGVSQTRFGAAEEVTCKQFVIFLRRALQREDEEYGLVADDSEINACDAAGFTRGDAALLSVRTLSENRHIKRTNDDSAVNYSSVAQYLIDENVFTTEQFREATWDILQRVYQEATARPDNTEGDVAPSCLIANVCVLRNDSIPGLRFCDTPTWTPTNQYYATVAEGAGAARLYRVDEKTLHAEPLATYSAQKISPIGKVGDTDYLVVGAEELTNKPKTVISVRGDEVGTLPIQCAASVYGVSVEEGSIRFPSEKGICVIDKNGIREEAAPSREKDFTTFGDYTVSAEISEKQTIIRCRKTATGEIVDSYTVINVLDGSAYQIDWSDEYACWQFGPSLHNSNSKYVWGTAGFYEMKNGRLLQRTARPAIDYGFDSSDDSIVIISHAPEERMISYGGGTGTFVGNEVVRIHADGTEQILLSHLPEHTLTLTTVSYATGGKVHVVYAYIMGMTDTHTYEYAVENGKLRALQHDAGKGWSGYDNPEEEQKRLDDLGVGVNA